MVRAIGPIALARPEVSLIKGQEFNMITLPVGTTGVSLKMEANDDMDIELQDVTGWQDVEADIDIYTMCICNYNIDTCTVILYICVYYLCICIDGYYTRIYRIYAWL